MFASSKRIFISYAREDSVHADELATFLKNNGFDPWIDREKIRVGDEWERVTRNKLKKSDFILVMLSDNAVNKQGFVRREFKLAGEMHDKRKTPVLPLRLDSCSIPEQFKALQVIDWNLDGQEELLDRLHKPGRRGRIFVKAGISVLAVLLMLLALSQTAKAGKVKVKINTSVIDQQTKKSVTGGIFYLVSETGDTIPLKLIYENHNPVYLAFVSPSASYKVIFSHSLYRTVTQDIQIAHPSSRHIHPKDTLIQLVFETQNQKEFTITGFNFFHSEIRDIYNRTGYMLVLRSGLVVSINKLVDVNHEINFQISVSNKSKVIHSRRVHSSERKKVLDTIVELLNLTKVNT